MGITEDAAKVISVKVALRCRPLVSKERNEGCQQCLTFVPNEPQVVAGKEKTFTYDYVYASDVGQEEVYRGSVQKLIAGLFKGYNATVLAYGQTGSGKTYTMGSGGQNVEQEVKGIIPRAVADIFSTMKTKKDWEFVLRVSFLELHNEEIHDLLRPEKDGIAIREDPENNGIKIAGLSEVIVSSAKDMLQCLDEGSAGRTTASTAMNTTSSRSHAVFTIHIEMRHKDSGDYCKAKFHLVDLAGSERVKKTKAEGDRFKEGVNINLGLLALGNVISALGDENQRKQHVPYRDSKLTRLLQDSLGGNSLTIMIACVSPADSNLEETVNTLRYADRARKIKNKPIINRDPQAAEVARLRALVQQLQVQLIQNGGSIGTGGGDGGGQSVQKLQERNRALEEENEKLVQELQSSVEQTRMLCEKVIMAEAARDKIKLKIQELKKQTGVAVNILNDTTDSEVAKQQRSLVDDLQTKIAALEDEERQIEEEEINLSNMEEPEENKRAWLETEDAGGNDVEMVSPSKGVDGVEMNKAYTLRQAKLTRDLRDLNSALALKEELVMKAAMNDDRMTSIRNKYDTAVNGLESEVGKLQKEKDGLVQELKIAKTNKACNKVSEQRRLRLKELEAQLGQVKKRLMEQTKMLRLKEQSDKKVEQMKNDVLQIKQMRVKLMKQMKEEADQFRLWKQKKEKEVTQLKAQDRKRLCDYKKLERQHQLQTCVLRRKTEQAAAATKRLRDAVSKRRETSRKIEQPLSANDIKSIGTRVKACLGEQLDVLVSTREAKRHLQSLLDDRRELAEQMAELRGKLQACGPATKRRAWEGGEDLDTSQDKADIRQQIAELHADMETRNVQIADMQQRLLDPELDDKRQQRWDSITTMAEAKCALKWLMQQVVDARLESGRNLEVKENLQDNLDQTVLECESLQNRMKVNDRKHEGVLLTTQRDHEDKLLYLLRQIPASSTEKKASPKTKDLIRKLKFQATEIEKLGGLHEQLVSKDHELADVQHKLSVAKLYSSKKMPLMPPLMPDDNASPDLQPPRKYFSRDDHAMTKNEKKQSDIVYLSDCSTDDGSFTDDLNDADWHATPYMKQAREAIRRARRTKHENEAPSKRVSSMAGCRCKKGTCKYCTCNKSGQPCGPSCACNAGSCSNRRSQENDDDSDATNTTYEVKKEDITVKCSPLKPVASPSSIAMMSPLNEKFEQARRRVTYTATSNSSDTDSDVAASTAVRVQTESPLEGGIMTKRRKLYNSGGGGFFRSPLN